MLIEELVFRRECWPAIDTRKKQKYSKQPWKLTLAADLVQMLQARIL